MNLLFNLLFIVLAYFLGSIPFGLIVGKVAGIGDIRQQGSGNIGATNMLRAGGKKLGIITLILDGLKGFIPVFLAKQYGLEWAVPLAALAAVLGHIFPIWLNFKGGKGVATAIAVYAALLPGLFIFAGFAWVAVFYISRISSLSSIVMMIATSIVAIFFANGSVGLAVLVISIIVVYKHKENIIRLMRGQEAAFSK
jgi:glycerol-3-phosphate acyltransferase PlsY